MPEQHIRLILAATLFLVIVGTSMAICRKHFQPPYRRRVMLFAAAIAGMASTMILVPWMWIPAAFVLIVSEFFMDPLDGAFSTIIGRLHLGATAFVMLDMFGETLSHAHKMAPAAIRPVQSLAVIEQLAVLAVMVAVWQIVERTGIVRRLAVRFAAWELRMATRNWRLEYFPLDSDDKA